MRARARPTTKADETQEFVEFWETWRPVMNRNDGRGAARDEFLRHVEQYGADPQDIIDGARWFVFRGGNSEFKLHAQTWLNRRAYEDYAEEWRAYQKRLQERQKGQENVVSMPSRPKTRFLQEWERRKQEQTS